MLKYEILFDHVSSDTFIKFISDLQDYILSKSTYKKQLLDGRVYIIMDNAKIHCSKETRRFFRTSKLNVLTLPAYSPDLNPCEYLFSTIKNRFYGSKLNSK